MTEERRHYWNQDRIMWLVIGLLLTAGIIWLIYYLHDALLPFFVACFVAYLLQPLMAFNMRWSHIRNRAVVSIITLLEVVAVIVGLGWLTIPSVIREATRLGAILQDIASGKIHLPDGYDFAVSLIDRFFNPDTITRTLENLRMQDVISRGSMLLQASTDVVFHTVAWLLTIIYVLFILIDYDEIRSGFTQIVPKKYRPKAMAMFNDVGMNVNHYFRGQGKVALCALGLYCLGFWIAGLPLAVPVGIMVGILYMIPYFQYITLIPVACICLVSSFGGGVPFWPEFGKCLLVYLVSQCVCDYLITPHVMGKELGLNAAIILLSLSVWGSLLGIIGMIIALPVTALIFQYYRTYISDRQ